MCSDTTYGHGVDEEKKQPTTANQRRKTKRRNISIDDPLWDRFEATVGPRGRAAVMRALLAYWLREPGAKMPDRPPRLEMPQDPSERES